MQTRAETAPRLASLPRQTVLGGIEVPVAVGMRARLLGLSRLDRERAGPGLLLPRCSSVHTLGMRFELDIYFLDQSDRLLKVFKRVAPRRVVGLGGASAVLELPAASRPFFRPQTLRNALPID